MQADIKTITSLGAHASTVITAITAQNSVEIRGIQGIPANFITKQFYAVIEDVAPDAVKIGMLLTGEAVRKLKQAVCIPAVSFKARFPIFDMIFSALTVLKDFILTMLFTLSIRAFLIGV